MVRELHKEDKGAVLDLVRATKNFSEPEIAIAEELIDIVTNNPDQKDYYAFVAEEDHEGAGTIAGFLLLGPTPATVGTYDMYWIATHPRYHGTGIAQALDRFADQFVRERNGYLIVAETSSQPGYERTRAFYAKQGYSEFARIADYYKPGDDLIIFGKRV